MSVQSHESAGKAVAEISAALSLPNISDNRLFLDLETTQDGGIAKIGAVLGGARFYKSGDCGSAETLRALDAFASDAVCVGGHNVVAHDLPLLAEKMPGLRLLALPVIDTLVLSSVCFPENPYHRLVKNYKLVSVARNDPVSDAMLARELLADEIESLSGMKETDESAFRTLHGLLCGGVSSNGLPGRGLALVFGVLGAGTPLDDASVLSGAKEVCGQHACRTASNTLGADEIETADSRTALAYVMAWLRVAGADSVLPAWVRRSHCTVSTLLDRLRDIPCDSPKCGYCRTIHNPECQLKRHFGFDGFRDKPADGEGRSLQREIVLAGMRSQSLLAIMPTGGGKSLCFQLPALIRNIRRGQLTIVISPLQALMKDQVDGLKRRTGQDSAAALNGLLTSPERADVLRRIRMGNIAILYVSPEQLRGRVFSEAIMQREIACWVLDEAHCLSKWGHDFRPDYLYAGRFIRRIAERQNTALPAIACFTATAKKDVIAEIIEYFRRETGTELALYEGGVERDNLSFEVQTIGARGKLSRVDDLLREHLAPERGEGSAIVFRASRAAAEETAEFLATQGWQAARFHAGLLPPEKKQVQDDFLSGAIRVICATNAFGMGVDKDNVRVVIHGDTPGSLENYLQEAGRAGRDSNPSRCILLYDEEDCEQQFRLNSLSSLSLKDIASILRGLRRLARNRHSEEVEVTTGELLRDETVDTDFGPLDNSADTKVRSAVAWLERAGFVERNENRTDVIQARLLVKSLDEARELMAKLGLTETEAGLWLGILREMMNADPSDMLSVDALSMLPEFQAYASGDFRGRRVSEQPSREYLSAKVFKVLGAMTGVGLLKKDTLLTAFVRYKIGDHSGIRLARVLGTDRKLLQLLNEEAPDPEGWLTLDVRLVNQRLLSGNVESSPELIRILLRSLCEDGRGFSGQSGSIEMRFFERDRCRVRLRRSWEQVLEIAERRRVVAERLLAFVLESVPKDTPARGDLKVEFAYEDLVKVIESDPVLRSDLRDANAAVERGLMFLHETDVMILQRGLAIFRSAMTIRIMPEAGSQRYSNEHYEALNHHYQERTFQVHVMNEYARCGLSGIREALQLVLAYFSLGKEEFIRRFFHEGEVMLRRATTARSYRLIVDELANPDQQRIVTASRRRNLLILAGPGSGKTRTVVHRCAYLLRVRRVRPESILVCCFNHSAALELRRRLRELAGRDALGVTIQTYHGIALRILGKSCSGMAESEISEGGFDDMILDAAAVLKGERPVPGVAEDEVRDRLLAGYEYILVDEYQDIDEKQYDLISAIAGRREKDDDRRLTILAVGDDDQNIYSFRGANVAFLRRFEQDYAADMTYLVENYRSTRYIIEAANRVISRNRDRMKTRQAIRINQSRNLLPAGGLFGDSDTLTRGRVSVIETADMREQAEAVILEIERLRDLKVEEWDDMAVLARNRADLSLVRALAEEKGIPVQWPLERGKLPALHRIREIWNAIKMARNPSLSNLRGSELAGELEIQSGARDVNPWRTLLADVMQEWIVETDDESVPTSAFVDYVYETLAQRRRDERVGRGVILNTVHGAKGMEYKHVLLCGNWGRCKAGEIEDERRVFYVGMTRAGDTLSIFNRKDVNSPLFQHLDGSCFTHRRHAGGSRVKLGEPRDYVMFGLEDVFMDFLGRAAANEPAARTLKALEPGSLLMPAIEGQRVVLKAPNGDTVAMLSSSAADTWRDRLPEIVEIRLLGAFTRLRSDVAEPEYAVRIRADEWEAPICEAVIRL